MNASFGAENGLQLLQTAADGSRYESASICKASRACSSKQLINLHELGNAIDNGKGKG